MTPNRKGGVPSTRIRKEVNPVRGVETGADQPFGKD
jgi:hypothetical protein